MTQLRYALAFGLALTITLAPLADARANRNQARLAFKKGRQLFKSGDFAAASVQLEKAYRLSPHPALLRYLGQTYYKWNKPEKALRYFKRYIKEAPQAPDRGQIETTVGLLEKVLASSAKQPTDPKAPAGDAKKPKPQPKIDLRPTGEDDEMPDVFNKPKGAQQDDAGAPVSFMTVGKWTSAGLAVTGLVMGITFNMLAQSKATELEDAVKASNSDGKTPTTSYSAAHFDMQKAYKRNNTIAIVSYVAGGVFAAAAVTLFILDGDKAPAAERAASSKPKRNVALVPAVGPGYYGLSGALTF